MMNTSTVTQENGDALFVRFGFEDPGTVGKGTFKHGDIVAGRKTRPFQFNMPELIFALLEPAMIGSGTGAGLSPVQTMWLDAMDADRRRFGS